MARWLTFDRNTASTLRKQLPREQVFEHRARSAVEYASDSNRDLVTLLPTGSSGEVAIAVFRQPAAKKTPALTPTPILVQKPGPTSAWKVVAPAPSAPTPAVPKVDTSPAQTPSRKPEADLPFVRQKPPVVRAGGILGTRDELVFEEDPVVKPKRNWWQRFWDEDE